MRPLGEAGKPWWRVIPALVCAGVPIATAMILYPPEMGQWTQLAIEHWIRTVLVMSMICLAFYRNVITKDRFEQGFVLFVVLLPGFITDTTRDSPDQLGQSTVALLLVDRTVLISSLAIAACVMFMIRAKRRDAPAD